MILWPLGFALVAMWFVFRDPAIDHRIVLLGSVLPLIVDAAIGRPTVPHTLLGSIGLLALVMAVTIGRRAARRRWLGLPIGTFFYLVAAGVWADRDLFWWPIGGVEFADVSLPVVDRPLAVIVVLEVLGLVALIWAYSTYGLGDAARRSRFARTGRIDRALIDPGDIPSC